MKAYAQRVETNSPWIDATPGHWRLSRFGYEAIINSGQVDPREEPWSSMVLVAPNHIDSYTGRLIGRETASEQGADSGKYLVCAGQILYSKIRPNLNKVAIAPEDCLCSADMYAISFRPGVDTSYGLYYMLARPFHSFTTIVSMRVKMPKVNREELAGAPWLVPPLDEQHSIVEFLDRETARIDALVAKQEQLITTLQERQRALAHHAILTSEPSRVRLSRYAKVCSGDGIDVSLVSRQDRSAGDIPVIGGNGVMGFTSKSNAEDSLVAIGRVGALCGNVHRVDGPAWITDNALRVEICAGFDIDYLRWALEILNLNSMSQSTAQPLITGTQIAALQVPMPSVEDQRKIAAHLNTQTSKIDTLIAKAEQFIALSKERRSALITAAVTGQIDVREMVS